MKRILYFMVLLLGGVQLLAAQENPLSRFEEANRHYEKGQYTEALRLYESMLPERPGSAVFYYNLGNAYYRNQQLGRAILSYERALRLAPRDRDVRHNLDLVRQLLKEPPAPFFDRLVSWARDLATLDELTWCVSLVYLGLVAGGIAFLFTRRQWLLAANLAILLLLFLVSGWLALKVNEEIRTSWAVVISGPADVRSGPGTENSVSFNLPEGKKVMVLGRKGGWAAVGLKTEGLRGWIEEKYIGEI